MSILSTLAVGILAKIVADEAKAILQSLSHHLLKYAISRLPESNRERFREEWHADLLSYPGEILRCIRAVGMCWASLKISWLGQRTLRELVAEKSSRWFSTACIRVSIYIISGCVMRLEGLLPILDPKKELSLTNSSACRKAKLRGRDDIRVLKFAVVLLKFARRFPNEKGDLDNGG
jgi:hypothetical protein